MICNLISSPKLTLMGFKRLKSMSWGGGTPPRPTPGALKWAPVPHTMMGKSWGASAPLTSLATLCNYFLFFFSTTKWHLCWCDHDRSYCTHAVAAKYRCSKVYPTMVQVLCSWLKVHRTTSASSLFFFQKSWDFCTIRNVYLCSDCMLNLTCNFNSVTKIYAFFFQ